MTIYWSSKVEKSLYDFENLNPNISKKLFAVYINSIQKLKSLILSGIKIDDIALSADLTQNEKKSLDIFINQNQSFLLTYPKFDSEIFSSQCLGFLPENRELLEITEPRPISVITDNLYLSETSKSYVNLIDGFLPIKNQGERGTCVAFGVGSMLEYIYNENTSENIELSEQFLYWGAKQRDGIKNSDGTYLWAAINTANEIGDCLAKYWKYNPFTKETVHQGPPPEIALKKAVDYMLPAKKNVKL